jgi:thioredoxin reductase (NADPH)
VIAATGARDRRLEVPRLERFEGVSVHYAATEAEALSCEGEEVVVVGGGNSAGRRQCTCRDVLARSTCS